METHQEKQEIFDRYAELQGYADWQNLLHKAPVNELPNHTFVACDLVQEEQQKRIADRFKTLAYSDQVDDIFVGDFEKMEDPITNPENLIK